MTSQNSEDSLTKQGITSEIVEEPDDGEYSSLRDQSKDYTLTVLNENHKHYKSISDDFEKCGLKVSKIQQLLNPEREKDYNSYKKNIKEARQKFHEGYELNEKYLYHGTTAKDIDDDIFALGLDEKFAKGNGHFGKGIYLSDSPSGFSKKAKLKDESEGFLLLCVRAFLGDIKVYADGEEDRKLNREPEKEGKFEGHRFYDSVQGRHNNLNEYVVYSPRRLIIEYLIHYHKSTQDAESEKLEVSTANVLPADGAVADDSDSRSNSPDPIEKDSDDSTSSASSDENEIKSPKIGLIDTDDNSSGSEDEEEWHETVTGSDTGSEAEDEGADSTGSPDSDSEDEGDIDFLKRQGITCQEVEDDPELDDALINAYRLVPLDNNHNHHGEISADFIKSHLRILKIEKVEYPTKLKEYKSAKDLMLDRVKSQPDFKINEKYLYHGTKVDLKELCEFGLDDKLAGKNGRFGQGIYLSDELGKCVGYTKCKKEDEGTILCVRALLGDIKIYDDGVQDKSLAREPKKPVGHTGWGFYDSVKGRPKDMTEYVVYRAARLFIQYVITFSKGSKYKRRDFPDGSSSQKLSDTCHAPGEELSPEGVALRDQFKTLTGETKNIVAEAYLWATCNTIDVAVDIYINKDKIEEEINKIREELKLKEQADDSDADMTFNPKGVPTYNSPEWKALSEDKAQEHIENFLNIFMAATEIDIKYKDIAHEFLKNKEYDIDQTLLAFYGSI